MITLRPFSENDYPTFITLLNMGFPDFGWTLETVRHWDAGWRPGGYFERRVLAEESGLAVGYSEISQARGQFMPDNYNLEVVVDPAARRRGIGLQLYEDARQVLRSRQGHWARCAVKESTAEGVGFARKIGAIELKRDWESRLDLTTFDPAPFAEAEERAIAAGVRLSTLAEEMRVDPAAVRKAYDLHAVARIDVPGLDPATSSPFERFEQEVLRAPYALPEAYFIAIRGDRYVGESALAQEGDDPTVIHQGLTGVLRDERGQGLAMALKLRTIDYGRAHGFRQIRTMNDSLNEPMLAINGALGFVREPAWITFGKDLSTP